MFRLVRTAVSLTILGVALWAAFAVDLGGRTFAEHVDTISETPEAEQLIEGTRSKINPALQELRDRVLGEYVEAPTWIPDPDAVRPRRVAADANEHERTVPASTLAPTPSPEPRYEPKLPGRRTSPKSSDLAPPLPGHGPSVPGYEPALPGRH